MDGDDVPNNNKAVNQYGTSVKEQLYQLEKLFNSELHHLRALIEHEKELRISYEKSVEKALELRAKEVERRLEGMNELRQQVVSDRAQFVRREIYDTRQDALDARVTAAEKLAATAAATLVGKAQGISTAQLWLGFVVIASVIIAVVGAVIGAR